MRNDQRQQWAYSSNVRYWHESKPKLSLNPPQKSKRHYIVSDKTRKWEVYDNAREKKEWCQCKPPQATLTWKPWNPLVLNPSLHCFIVVVRIASLTRMKWNEIHHKTTRLQMDKHNGDRLKWLSLQGLEFTAFAAPLPNPSLPPINIPPLYSKNRD